MSASICVLVPVHGEAKFLGNALASLCAQTFTDWQAVVCPIGAAHCSPMHSDSRIQQAAPQASMEAALAHASAHCSSPYLCVLEGDDALDARALAQLHACLHAQPDAGMAYSQHVLLDASGRVLGPGPLCELPYSAEALLLDFMTGPLRLFRTEAFQRAGGYTTAHLGAADYDLCLRLSEISRIVHLPKPLYARRIHPDAPEVAQWAQGIEARYAAFLAAVQRRGLDAQFDCALQIDSWHVLQPLHPFGGVPALG
jgi:hypothetical protein